MWVFDVVLWMGEVTTFLYSPFTDVGVLRSWWFDFVNDFTFWIMFYIEDIFPLNGFITLEWHFTSFDGWSPHSYDDWSLLLSKWAYMILPLLIAWLVAVRWKGFFHDNIFEGWTIWLRAKWCWSHFLFWMSLVVYPWQWIYSLNGFTLLSIILL